MPTRRVQRCIAGEPPAVIAKWFVKTPLDVAALREGVPGPVSPAVQQALARVAVDRSETGALFVTALNAIDTAPAKLAAPPKALAILPFENLNADPDNQYFADGIVDDILDAPVQIDGLHVAARNSAHSFRGTHTALADIGEKLHVATVLQESVRKTGNRMGRHREGRQNAVRPIATVSTRCCIALIYDHKPVIFL